jgi:hypothetical protein
MSITLRLAGLLAKVETIEGSDAAPAANADGVMVAAHLWPTITVDYAWEDLRTDVVSSSILPLAPGTPHGRMATINIPWEVKGAGSDTQIEAAPLLRACGWSETDGTNIFTYALAAPPHDSCTIWAYAGGMLFKVVGCRGTLRWPHTPGQNGVMYFNMQGFVSAEPAAAAVASISSYDTTAPIACVAYTMTVGSWSPDAVAAEFNQGANLQRLDSLNATDGIRTFDWSYANPQVTLSVRAPEAAGIYDTGTYNPWDDAKTRTPRAIGWTQGSVQYNRLVFAAPVAYVKLPRNTEQGEFVGQDLTYDLTTTTPTIVTS